MCAGVCMRFALLLCLVPASAFARPLSEIKSSKTLNVGMREKDLVYRPTGEKQLHQKLVEEFAKDLGVKVNVLVVKEMKEYWSKNGEVKQGETYTPDLFKKVDLYADSLTVNEWRVKLANPHEYLDVTESYLCNFQDTNKLADRVKAGEIPLYTVEQSSYHSIIQKMNVPKKSVNFVKATSDLVPAVKAHKGQACTILDSDQAVLASGKELKYSGAAVIGKNQLAWWTETNNGELQKSVDSFWEKIKQNKFFHQAFQEAYKTDYKIYIKLLSNIGLNSLYKAFK